MLLMNSYSIAQTYCRFFSYHGFYWGVNESTSLHLRPTWSSSFWRFRIVMFPVLFLFALWPVFLLFFFLKFLWNIEIIQLALLLKKIDHCRLIISYRLSFLYVCFPPLHLFQHLFVHHPSILIKVALHALGYTQNISHYLVLLWYVSNIYTMLTTLSKMNLPSSASQQSPPAVAASLAETQPDF